MSSSVEMGLLGPLLVRRNGEEVRIAAPKQRALLALLGLDAGRTVSTDELIDRLWSGRPPESAPTALQVYVSQLRKQLGAEAIRTSPPGYALELPADAVDVHQFERLVRDGRALLASGDPATAGAM